ncbi:cob(I)yrinic acid a,c-diamide adenosyltransferase [Belliella kenyensis]|uniref:Corrinoid adenosyltransferase n=1 Tax=Belliella kenyensis TaxID=1472724 RepID=A0ABV8EQ71_9BACT|nr:cob(I)yrinic acid a,c-diamide adenosyltransferase [Belliella kenyensis]MCH7402081.1 cob(I)yrinic acid a,c-diamide adenosyltransferase [Belliella kenyensis]MDN3601523.1 cob(I)yrinic acid a,c-diamide adenosyltransferase [Belliella kenyensis]MDN3605245.1 cob(I)yrinic acid a,c-diamide adenosyltransferase [Belliella kenyensis]
MKIYTKTGDQGTTSLLGGKRVPKGHPKIDAYGTVDELNAFIGLLRDQEVNKGRIDILKEIQDRLFTIGATLATEVGKTNVKRPDIHEDDLEILEREIDAMETKLPPLKHFILPGGHQAVSFCHVARTVCRRTERAVIDLMEIETVDEILVKYLNRLSDYLFVLGRLMAIELDVEEVIWNPRS